MEKGKTVEIDGYHACPCHSEKKIKFCCGKEILGDLNQLVAKQRAGQELAAIEEVDRAIQRHGPQDCLLTMKIQLLLEHGEVDKALEVNSQFLAKNPQHPAGFHQLALLRLEKRDIEGAVDALQDAVDAVKGNEVPVFLITGFRAVGYGLLVVNLPLAARAHFRFASYLSGDQDQQLTELYSHTLAGREFGFMQRVRFQIPDLSAEELQQEWAKKITTAQRAIGRGQFRKSLKYLELAAETYPNNARIIQAIAILTTYLADREKAAGAWKRYADLADTSEARSIEAEILSFIYRLPSCHDQVETVAQTVEISDFNGAIEQALSHPLMRSLPTDDWDQEGPPPRNTFLILNRPPTEEISVSPDRIPYAIGSLECFGKQTDREARFVWLFDDFPECRNQIEEIQAEFERWAAGPLSQTGSELQSFPYNLRIRDWLFPSQLQPLERQRIISELLFQQVSEQWTDQPTRLLENKSPREAAQVPALRRKLQGIVISMYNEILCNDLGIEKLTELWEKLGLPTPAVEQLGDRLISDLSPLELASLKLTNLTKDQLSELIHRAAFFGLKPLLRESMQQLLHCDEPPLAGFENHAILHQLGLLETDFGRALDLLARARSKAAQAQVPIGNYLVDEFQFRLSRGITEKLDDLLTLIYKAHIREPNVAQRIAQVLQRFGLSAVPEEQDNGYPLGRSSSHSPSSIADSPEAPNPKQESKLWLPD